MRPAFRFAGVTLGLLAIDTLLLGNAQSASQPTKKDTVKSADSPLPPGAVKRFGATPFLHEGIVKSVAFSPDGKLMASGGVEKYVRFWDVASGKELFRLPIPNDIRISNLTFSPDGKTFAASGTLGGVGNAPVVALWDLAKKKVIWQFESDVKNVSEFGAMIIAFSADGRTLAGGNAKGTVLLWETATLKLRHEFQGDQGAVFSLAFQLMGNFWLVAAKRKSFSGTF
jgi:WD40 repeat protein